MFNIRKSLKKLKNMCMKVHHKTWNDIEYFDENWKERIKIMSDYIPSNVEVLDLGCGKMWLKDMVQVKNYYPVDYCYRGLSTIISDFNKYQFPSIKADVALVSGCLEYVIDYEWFIKNIALHSNRCIMSYCIKEEFPDLKTRNSMCWVNCLSKDELINIFQKNNFHLSNYIKTPNKVHIFVFDKNLSL